MNKLLIIIAAISLLSCESIFGAANTNGYDTTRLQQVMAKARRGETITVGVIGGSITAGTAASSEDKRWANQVKDWWKTNFPTATINFVNAGIGGTGTDIATHRVQGDLLKSNPDFVVIEFSVNDSKGDYAAQMMEALVRQILNAANKPAVMILMLKQENGTTAQESHKIVGNHYKVPMVSFADLIDAQVAKDGKTLHECFSDGLHPLDLGMTYIAKFIGDELKIVKDKLPADAQIAQINTTLPAAQYGTVFEKTYKYDNTNIVPTINSGWKKYEKGWSSTTSGAELEFKVDGNAISILYTQYFTKDRGQAEVWVDNGPKKKLDAYFTEQWGPAVRFAMIAENLSDGEHTLHIRLIDAMTSPSTGHFFQVMNVQKAGNITKAAPIAVLKSDFMKAIKNTSIALDGSGSYDPDGNSISAYTWSIVEKPAGSNVSITNATQSTSTITPDIKGIYKIGLVVTDGESNSLIKEFNLSVRDVNNVPIAKAGNDATVLTTKKDTLDGTASSDADGDGLTYEWKIISQPAGSAASFMKNTTAKPILIPMVEGEYKISLIVNDSLDKSKTDTIVITAVKTLSSIQNKKEIHKFDVYPNPANDEILVSANNVSEKDMNIMISNLDGKIIYSKKLKVSNGSVLARIDTSNYPEGAYMLSSSSYSTKFVVMR